MEMKDRIKERRLALGLTQEELADKLNLKKSAIAKYENGRVENIKRSVIAQMASALECSPGYLLALDNDEEDTEQYYLNDDARDLAQFLYENPEYKVLFDASRKVKKDDIQLIKTMIDRMAGDE